MQAAYAQNSKDSIPESKELNEVIIAADHINAINKTEALNIVTADANYLLVNRGSSLMNSLDKIPGVKSMQIGQGFSKPMLRGLGFNRVAVLQNGIKQQGQQWGADHGLEIDQFDVENTEIHKGAASLQYGSDAIAGAIKLLPLDITDLDFFKNNILLNGASNNRLFGGSFDSHYQKDRKYIKGRFTYQNFEDYRVPAKTFDYLGWQYPIHNSILKNTAGREYDFSLQGGVSTSKLNSNILISNVRSKTGFFAGAHGIPTLVNLEDDGDYRNIDLPYQSVNHFKAIYNQTLKLDNQTINFDLGYQNNNRKEFSKPHTHGIGNLPDTDLELELKLQTFTANGSWVKQINSLSKITVGINTEYQDNNIGGYSFLLPQFEQLTVGIFVINRQRLSEKIVLTSGIRYDQGRLHIHEYLDPNISNEHKVRAEDMTKNMGDFSFSTGLSYAINPLWTMKANLGKSFRMATANELSSNGVHHGTFRHEVGDKNLKAEQSYQLDYGIDYKKKFNSFFNEIAFNTNLFANYFPNFIFLNPTGEFSWLPDAGQYYKYEQSKALRYGGEASLSLTFAEYFKLDTGIDYIYAKDLDSKYPIPFTPPMSIINQLQIKLDKILPDNNTSISFTHRYSAAQNRVSRNELSTPSHHLFDAAISGSIAWQRQQVIFALQAQNIMNKKYYNHLSFYRNLDLPEIGRNFRLTIQIPITLR